MNIIWAFIVLLFTNFCIFLEITTSWQQPHHDHFIRMPETARPRLLPFNYLPVSLKISASDPVTLSWGEKKVYLSHWFQVTTRQIRLKRVSRV